MLLNHRVFLYFFCCLLLASLVCSQESHYLNEITIKTYPGFQEEMFFFIDDVENTFISSQNNLFISFDSKVVPSANHIEKLHNLGYSIKYNIYIPEDTNIGVYYENITLLKNSVFESYDVKIIVQNQRIYNLQQWLRKEYTLLGITVKLSIILTILGILCCLALLYLLSRYLRA